MGRTIGSAVVGAILGFLVGIDLVLFGAVALASPMPMILTIIGLVGGGIGGWFASARRRSGDQPT